MLLSCWTENEEIVKVNEKERKRAEEGVHETLEGLGGFLRPNGMKLNWKRPKGLLLLILECRLSASEPDSNTFPNPT